MSEGGTVTATGSGEAACVAPIEDLVSVECENKEIPFQAI